MCNNVAIQTSLGEKGPEYLSFAIFWQESRNRLTIVLETSTTRKTSVILLHTLETVTVVTFIGEL